MRYAISALILLAMISLLLSCSERAVNSKSEFIGPTDNSLMPMTIGNTWTYERATRTSPMSPTVYDTVTVRIVSMMPDTAGDRYQVDGAMGSQQWQNRSDGVYAQREDGEWFLLFGDPYSGPQDWQGPGNKSSFRILPAAVCYAEVPGMGSFIRWRNVEYFHDAKLGTVSYYFAPGLGIVSLHRQVVDSAIQVSYAKEVFRLIDYHILDPIVDTTGTIAYWYHMAEPGLAGIDFVSIDVILDEAPWGSTCYGYFKSFGPQLLVGGCNAIDVSDEAGAPLHTHRVEIGHVPSGVRSMQMVLTVSAGFGIRDTLSVVTVDAVHVKRLETTELGTIQAF